MGRVLWMQVEKGKAKEKAKLLKERLQQKMAASQRIATDDVVDLTMEEHTSGKQNEDEAEKEQVARTGELEKSETLASILDQLGLEDGVAELLAKNTKALVRLEELQVRRLGEKGGSRAVEVASEEWEIGEYLARTCFGALLNALQPKS